jgi:hypothetical protein
MEFDRYMLKVGIRSVDYKCTEEELDPYRSGVGGNVGNALEYGKGTKVVCIDPDRSGVGGNVGNALEYGKVYVVAGKPSEAGMIQIDLNGRHLTFYASRFMTLDKIRNIKLETLLEL